MVSRLFFLTADGTCGRIGYSSDSQNGVQPDFPKSVCNSKYEFGCKSLLNLSLKDKDQKR